MSGRQHRRAPRATGRSPRCGPGGPRRPDGPAPGSRRRRPPRPGHPRSRGSGRRRRRRAAWRPARPRRGGWSQTAGPTTVGATAATTRSDGSSQRPHGAVGPPRIVVDPVAERGDGGRQRDRRTGRCAAPWSAPAPRRRADGSAPPPARAHGRRRAAGGRRARAAPPVGRGPRRAGRSRAAPTTVRRASRSAHRRRSRSTSGHASPSARARRRARGRPGGCPRPGSRASTTTPAGGDPELAGGGLGIGDAAPRVGADVRVGADRDHRERDHRARRPPRRSVRRTAAADAPRRG